MSQATRENIRETHDAGYCTVLDTALNHTEPPPGYNAPSGPGTARQLQVTAPPRYIEVIARSTMPREIGSSTLPRDSPLGNTTAVHVNDSRSAHACQASPYLEQTLSSDKNFLGLHSALYAQDTLRAAAVSQAPADAVRTHAESAVISSRFTVSNLDVIASTEISENNIITPNTSDPAHNARVTVTHEQPPKYRKIEKLRWKEL